MLSCLVASIISSPFRLVSQTLTSPNFNVFRIDCPVLWRSPHYLLSVFRCCVPLLPSKTTVNCRLIHGRAGSLLYTCFLSLDFHERVRELREEIHRPHTRSTHRPEHDEPYRLTVPDGPIMVGCCWCTRYGWCCWHGLASCFEKCGLGCNNPPSRHAPRNNPPLTPYDTMFLLSRAAF